MDARIPAGTSWIGKGAPLKGLSIAWLVAYVYLVYAFLGRLPSLGSLAAFSTAASSGLLIVVYLFHSYLCLGWRNASKYLAIALSVSYVIEAIGTTTGYPFGSYAYTSALGPLLGPVPVFIPFLWAALGYFAIVAAGNYVVAAVLMVLFDVSFDPRLSQSLWHWATPGPYFGVPLSNFVGWFITSLAFFVVFYLATRKRVASSVPAIGFYFLFGAEDAVSDVSAGLAAAGAVALILFALASVLLYLHLEHRLESGRVVVTKTTGLQIG